MVNVRSISLDELKKTRLISTKRFILHALFLGAIFGFFGYFLVGYGFLSPIENSPPIGSIEIRATGSKDKNSKSAEVWFYGAFRVGDDKKIPWSHFAIDSSWEKRDDIHVSYKTQPNIATLKYEEPLRLDFGSHPYSGIVSIKWRGNTENINLYSKNNEVKSITIDQRPTYRNSRFYSLILVFFVFCGVLLAAAFVLLGWKKTYHWIFSLFLLFSLYLTLSAFFPGVYTNDSADQLRQALTESYQDWHPPLMAWLWSVLINATGHIESLMVFHLLLLMAAAIYWARIFECLQIGFSALVIPAFLASPIVINFSGVVWKDVGFAFSLFLCCGIVGLALVEKCISLSRSIVVISLLTYASGVRLNGILAIFPIAIFLIWLIVTTHKPKFSRTATIAFTATTSFFLLAVLVAGVQLFSYQYLKTEKRYPIQYLELYDIAGISSISSLDYFPDFIKKLPEHNIQRISEGYAKSISWGNANNLLFPNQDGSASLIPLSTDAELQRQLRASWLKAIFEEPSAYLKHRLSVVNFLMSKGFYSSEKPQSNAGRKLVLEANSVEQKMIRVLEFNFPGEASAKEFLSNSIAWTQGSFLYIGWFWLILLLVELFVGLIIMQRARSGLLIVMVSASGLLYVLPYLIVAPASDFRYLYWSSISGGISLILIMVLAIDVALKGARFCICNRSIGSKVFL
jgi:hypothetical protein